MKPKTAKKINTEAGVMESVITVGSRDFILQPEVSAAMVEAVREARKEGRQDTAREIFEVYDPYIKGLEEENGSLVGLACVHGWSSSKVEFGKKCRANIQALKSKYLKE